MAVPERVFNRDEARAAADAVIGYNPAVGREYSLVPSDRAAAEEAVDALSEHWQNLAPTFKSAIEAAASNAGLLSDDPLQGIAELIQNADDVAAQRATLAIDESNSILTFQHNGTPLTLHDVWGLAIPWLSMKASDPEALGRFGIGLKTLRSLSTTLLVHQGHFSVEIDDGDLRFVPGAKIAPNSDPALTTFAIPFSSRKITPRRLSTWVAGWGDAGLVFLRSLETITVVGNRPTTLHVDRSVANVLTTEAGDLARSLVSGSSDRAWTVYSRMQPVTENARRARKATSSTVTVSIAFPEFTGDAGFVHVGLPVREVGLPFRINAPFDPLASRRDLSDEAWNAQMLQALADLWRDAIVDRFVSRPTSAWAGVPLASEVAQRPLTPALHGHLESMWLRSARLQFSDNVRMLWNGEQRELADLAYESIELDGLLTSDDVLRLAGSVGALAPALRSIDLRWRQVIDEIESIGGQVPSVVGVADSINLLNDPKRSPAFVADLLAVALTAGQKSVVAHRKCIVLTDGSRAMPVELTGVRVLTSPKAAPLWATLGIGAQLHPAYRRRPGWSVVREWLRAEKYLVTDATDEAALRALARGGVEGEVLADALTDAQLEALRTALEDVGKLREMLGPGIGRAVKVNGQQFGPDGRRAPVAVRPAESYYIEGSATSFSVAAGQTRGLAWIERRYSDVLRAGEGLGAQRFFTLLGAERAPRLVKHRQAEQRYQGKQPGVPRWADDAPSGRALKMVDVGATYTLSDLESPDMVRVLKSIAAEKDIVQRLRRTNAMLSTLGRAWDRYELEVDAVVHDRAWYRRARIPAWWLFVAMSAPWLTAEDGTAKPPMALNLRTPVNLRSLGDDPSLFLHPGIDPQAVRNVLEALGVRGDPGLSDLVSRLRAIASSNTADPEAAADEAAPFYVSLASQIVSGEFADSRTRLRSEFNLGTGLIASNRGWKRASVVYSGAPVFGRYLDFVPSVPGTEPLWSFLNIMRPGVSEAVEVLRVLGQSKQTALEQDDEMVMLEALRILATSPTSLPRLTRAAVWVGSRWTTERPVFAVSNPWVAKALSARLPVWTPGGSIAPLESLIEPFGIVRLDERAGAVVGASEAVLDDAATATFRAAILNLRQDLALSDPAAEQSGTVPWDELERWTVQTLPGLEVVIPSPVDRAKIKIEIPGWADRSASTVYVSDARDLGSERGAQAIAALFSTDPRRISHDWLAAWAKAKDGLRAERLETAAARDSRLKVSRARAAELAASKDQLTKIASRTKKRSATIDKSHQAKQSTPSPPLLPASRLLIEIDDYVIVDEKGELIGNGASPPVPRGRGVGPRLREAERTNPKRTKISTSRPMNFTAEEREDLGSRLAEWVLGLTDKMLVDIRNQAGVGADAIDEDDNYYEYKVHSGAIRDDVRLEPAEFERALIAKDKYHLVLIGNVEEGKGEPEVRVIADPLKNLTLESSQAIKLTGISKASQVLRFKLAPRPV